MYNLFYELVRAKSQTKLMNVVSKEKRKCSMMEMLERKKKMTILGLES